MSEKREVTCDRCGDVILDIKRCGLNMLKECSAKIHFWGVGHPRSYGEQRIDLCEKCANEFITFLENGKG